LFRFFLNVKIEAQTAPANHMFTNRSMLIGISLLAIIGGGVYFSLSGESNSQGNALVESENASSTSAAFAASIKNCPFETSGTPKHGPVIINEIAWMGTKDSANDEWIELKNISGSTSSMAGWELINQNEKIKVVFKSGAKIGADSFYLLERGSADFLTGIKADTFFTGSLKNNGDNFRLFDKNCGLIDEIISSSSWPAGDNAARKTLERDWKTFAWHTSTSVGGTPKAENDIQNNQTPIINDARMNNSVIPAQAGILSNDKNLESSDSQDPRSPEQATPVDGFRGDDNTLYSINSKPPSLTKSNVNHILISQVQITGGTGKTNNDFIEIYNPTNLQVNLKGYRLVKRAQNGTSDILIKSWTVDTFIPAFGFYLWANSSYTDISVAPDATTSEDISDDNGIAIRFGPNDTGVIIDSVAWGNAQNAFVDGVASPLNPSAGQSLLRKGWQNGACFSASLDSSIGNGCDTGNNALDFELMRVSVPRDSQIR
jgi:hypothetical protein